MLNISFGQKNLYENDAIAVLVNDQLKIDPELIALDQKFHGVISKTIANTNKFTGKFGQTVTTSVIDKDGLIKEIILVGIGDEATLLADYKLEEIGGKIYSCAKSARASSIGIMVYTRINNHTDAQAACLLASGALLASYQFDKYLTKRSDYDKFMPTDFNLLVTHHESAQQAFANKKALAMGVYLARDLVSEAPNILYPASYAEIIQRKLEPLGIEVQILGEREMRNLGMGAILGVGQGSTCESQVVIMQYTGSTAHQKPISLVGKGVTFDTGGISIKSAPGMSDMKYDMGGSAAVVGVLYALALQKAPVNVIGIVGLVENMPSGGAQRPGDVVHTMSGQTVEILNTDAEGRLVLCDCITYLQKHFESECIVDLATLTGAIVVSLAHTYAGLFSNDNVLAKQLITASHKVNEQLWRMPLHDDFNDMLKSPIADMANIGNEKGSAGSSTAAHFIGRFIHEGVKWAHLDIAGMAWDKVGKNPICPKGAVGFGVRLLNQFIHDYYEAQ